MIDFSTPLLQFEEYLYQTIGRLSEENLTLGWRMKIWYKIFIKIYIIHRQFQKMAGKRNKYVRGQFWIEVSENDSKRENNLEADLEKATRLENDKKEIYTPVYGIGRCCYYRSSLHHRFDQIWARFSLWKHAFHEDNNLAVVFCRHLPLWIIWHRVTTEVHSCFLCQYYRLFLSYYLK